MRANLLIMQEGIAGTVAFETTRRQATRLTLDLAADDFTLSSTVASGSFLDFSVDAFPANAITTTLSIRFVIVFNTAERGAVKRATIDVVSAPSTCHVRCGPTGCVVGTKTTLSLPAASALSLKWSSAVVRLASRPQAHRWVKICATAAKRWHVCTQRQRTFAHMFSQ